MRLQKLLQYLLTAVLAVTFLFIAPVYGQNDEKSYSEMEVIQDKIEKLYSKAYDIMSQYPDVTYKFEYDDSGKVTSLTINGVANRTARDQLKVYIMDIEDLKHEIINDQNRMGVYYAAEKAPKPKVGYVEFYRDVRSNIAYPEDAIDQGVEGIIYAKFVVDDQGLIHRVFCSEDIDTIYDSEVEKMKSEVKSAILETSGEWEPAKIGNTPVSHWVVIPVQFNKKKDRFRPVIWW